MKSLFVFREIGKLSGMFTPLSAGIAFRMNSTDMTRSAGVSAAAFVMDENCTKKVTRLKLNLDFILETYIHR
ncbi:hypothetical protein EBU99_08825 [bacterium]|nr:hypothetical protein [bacterium]